MISLLDTWAKWKRDGTAQAAADALRAEWKRRFPDVPIGKVRGKPYESAGVKFMWFMANDADRAGYALRLRYYPHDQSREWQETRP